MDVVNQVEMRQIYLQLVHQQQLLGQQQQQLDEQQQKLDEQQQKLVKQEKQIEEQQKQTTWLMNQLATQQEQGIAFLDLLRAMGSQNLQHNNR